MEFIITEGNLMRKQDNRLTDYAAIFTQASKDNSMNRMANSLKLWGLKYRIPIKRIFFIHRKRLRLI